MAVGMTLQLQVRPFSFSLLQPLRTATGVLLERRGWLLRLCDSDTGAVGWGEVAPLRSEQWFHCQLLVGELTHEVSRDQLEALITSGAREPLDLAWVQRWPSSMVLLAFESLLSRGKQRLPRPSCCRRGSRCSRYWIKFSTTQCYPNRSR